MSRTTSTTRLENRIDERIFSSPVARAFVRTVVSRRGVTEAQARQLYQDYLARAEAAPERGPSTAAR